MGAGVYPLLAGSDQVGGEVQGVAAWWAAESGWWVELRDTVDHFYPPAGMVQESVVATAERNTIINAGGAMISPVDKVVNFAPAGRYRTTWKGGRPGRSGPPVWHRSLILVAAPTG
ncbi:MAG: hypothetical protein WCC38_04495 [Pseudonocardiaceae bacterium]